MKSWNYFNPVRVHFGEGCLDELPNVLGKRKALIVTYPEASYTNLLHRLEKLTGSLLLGLIDEIPPLPEISDLGALYDFVRQDFKAAEVIVAVGGGSVMDTGKILATTSRGRTFAGMMDAVAMAETGNLTALPVVAVPTTAGTGSEVTPWATFWDKKAGRKHSLHFPGLFPESALVDPLLTTALPPGPTLAGGLDALSHACEAIWNRNANPVSDLYAIAAAKEVLATLPLLMKKPGELRLRSRMAKAALLAGLAFSNTQTALAHSISYPMTLRYGLPHGIACSFCLPLVMRMALGKDPSRDNVLREVFGRDLEDAPKRLEDFLEDLGVRAGFSGYGVGREDAERIVGEAGSGPRGRNFIL
jgi:hypothetical protein